MGYEKKEHKQQEVCRFASCARVWGAPQEAAAITQSSSFILKCSYPPRHDAATHLCHMMINNALVRGAVISP